MVQQKALDPGFKAKRARVVVVLFMTAVYVGPRCSSAPYETKLSSHSIDFQVLLFFLKHY